MTEEQREQEHRKDRRRATEALIALLGVAVLISFTLWYVAYSQREADLRWCSLMVPLDDRYQKLVDPSPDAKQFADSVHVLRSQLHCPPHRIVIPTTRSNG